MRNYKGLSFAALACLLYFLSFLTYADSIKCNSRNMKNISKSHNGGVSNGNYFIPMDEMLGKIINDYMNCII